MDEGAFSILEAALGARCRDIDRIVNRIAERRGKFDQGSAADVDSMGYQLHNLYGAFEQLFEEVARFFENRIDDSRYHANLIRRMQLGAALFRRRSREVMGLARAAWQELLDPAKAG